MSSPYPGMDPYLEGPGLWPDVHARLIAISSEVLAARLRPKYFVRIEERLYVYDEDEVDPSQRVADVRISTRPGWGDRPFEPGGAVAVEEIAPIVATTKFRYPDEVRETRLEVIDVASRSVVTVMEVLSPANKTEGTRGWLSFDEKRQEVMDSPAHRVEVDLLRAGTRLRTREPLPPCEYLIHVSRVRMRPKDELWPIRLSQRLPSIPIPLAGDDPDARLDLQAVLDTAYDRAGYDLSVDYTREPVPPLAGEWAAWSDRLLRAKGLRNG